MEQLGWLQRDMRDSRRELNRYSPPTHRRECTGMQGPPVVLNTCVKHRFGVTKDTSSDFTQSSDYITVICVAWFAAWSQ